MFLFVVAVGIQAIATMAMYAPGWVALWLLMGAVGVLGMSQVLRWWARRSDPADSTVARAFGAAGLVCLVAAATFLDLDRSTAPLFALALTFVVVATAALATWPGWPLQTFGGLWVLAIAFNTAFWFGAGDTMAGGVVGALYIGTIVGTTTFGVWVACGLIVLGLAGVPNNPRQREGDGRQAHQRQHGHHDDSHVGSL